jgi:cell division protein FtsW
MIAFGKRETDERSRVATGRRPAVRRAAVVAVQSQSSKRRPGPASNDETSASRPVPRSATRTVETVATDHSAMGALDYPLIGIVATLMVLGLAMVYSASLALYGTYYFIRQIGMIGAGLVVLVITVLMPYNWWRHWAIPIMLVTVALLVAVLFIGEELLGARRTLFHGSVQPSEIAKLAVVIYVAAWVASKRNQLAQVQGGLFPFAVLMGIIAGLIVLEHSFSITIIILVTGVTMFFVGGGSAKQLAFTGLIAVGVLALLMWRWGYGANRIQDWWAYLNDPTKASYVAAQAMEIIKRGGGIGTNALNIIGKTRVPLLWSDYLFANIGADLSFVGTLGVVILYALLAYRGLGIALKAPDQFGSLAAIGVTVWLVVQALIHIGTSLALIPATGVPLPFMSYGGSAMVACLASIGLLLNISRASPQRTSGYANYLFGWRHRGSRRTSSGGDQRTAATGSRPLPADQKPRKRSLRKKLLGLFRRKR